MYESMIGIGNVEASDIFNLARGLDLYVVASLCSRLGLTMPETSDRVACGFCLGDGTPTAQGDATHFGWTLNPK